ncbi:MAG: nucleotidyltransferase [Clostridiales bacterium]|nr:nucleotidyltransferase [Candidatus Crickella caballi]
MEPILVIMAAGMGSRYGGNKQLDKITDQGDIIMDFSLFDAYEAGFRRVCFIIKHDFEDVFKAHIEGGAGKKYETYYAFQELDDLPSGYSVPEGRTKPYGTGQAVLAARDIIDAPFAVINADDYYGKECFVKLYSFLKNDCDAAHHCMVGFKIENTLSENGTVSRGICTSRDGKMTGIVEHLAIAREANGEITDTHEDGSKEVIPSDAPVSMNCWGFSKEYVDAIKAGFVERLEVINKENPLKGEFYIQSPINAQIAEGSCEYKILTSGDKWFGVTYKEDKPDVVAKFKALKEDGTYPVELWG